jgi:hypothetical protein
MHLAEGLQRLGFRKWYERQLLQSHAHLVLTIFSTLGLMGALEAASKFHSWQDQLTDALALLASAAIGLWSLRRYLYLLKHAEYVAHQARCPACQTYARFTLVGSPQAGQPISVCCRQCQHRWTIEA